VSKRTKFLLGIGVIAALVIGWQVAAFAVHNEVFQLEGNAVDDAASSLPDDWENICKKATATATTPLCTSAANPSATDTSFVTETNTAESVFDGGGSKDPLDLQGGPWKYKSNGGLPGKDNLLHSYAATYTVGTKELLYFGGDRYDTSGDATFGFWFFQNPVALSPNNPPANDAGTFTGTHKDGDLLIISSFSNGGANASIDAYTWDAKCGAKGPNGEKVQPNPTAGQCADNNLRLKVTSGTNSAACGNANPDTACAIVNSGTIRMPWPFVDKSGTTLPDSTADPDNLPDPAALPNEFFEGGLDLSTLGLADECFSTALAETRSSRSTAATLQDFTIGKFGNCSSGTTSTPQKVNADGTTSDITGPLSIGTGKVQVADKATVTVTGGSPTWSGTMSFFLCKVDDPGLCTTGGTTINDGPTGANAAKPVTSASPTATSSFATVTSAGRYCWRAVFSGDPAKSVPGSSDATSGECFTVNPVTPTLATTAGDDVTLGNPVTDTATLTGTATQPTNPVINLTNTAGAAAGGTITFKLYGPSDSGCGTLRFTSNPVSVSGDSPPAYGPVSFTPTAAMGPGNYHWVAEYSGNSPNTNVTDHNTACTDTNETVVVNQQNATVSSTQDWLPNDTAIVNHGGSVTFTLLKNATVTDDGHACSSENPAIFSETQQLTASGSNFTASTTNTTHKVTSVGAGGDTYTWKIEVPQDGAFKAVTSCVEATQFTSLDNGGTVTSQ
jgi:hypothetical protein